MGLHQGLIESRLPSGSGIPAISLFGKGIPGHLLAGYEFADGTDLRLRQSQRLDLHRSVNQCELHIFRGHLFQRRSLGRTRDAAIVATGASLAIDGAAILSKDRRTQKQEETDDLWIPHAG